jgi:hypothetical protein
MSIRYRALAAPIALLLLAACSDQQTAANAYQNFADTKHPGVVGAILDAVGHTSDNPEVAAAIDAGSVVRDQENADRLEAEALAAADSGNVKKAEAALRDVDEIGRTPDLDIMSFNIAVQLGEKEMTDRFKAIRTQMQDNLQEAKDGRPSLENAMYIDKAVTDTEDTMRRLATSKTLSARERHDRQQYAAYALAEFYGQEAAMSRLRGFDESVPKYEARQRYYENMVGALFPEKYGDDAQ